MKKPWLFIILAGLTGIFSLPAIAQNAAPVRIWDYGFGGSGYDQLNCLEQTTDGGYILGGFSDSGLNGDKTQLSKGVTDYWIIRTDSNGTKRWDKTIGGSNGDYLYTIKQTSDEGFILGGWSESGSSGDKTQVSRGSDDYWIVKLDSNGTKLWDKSFGGASHDLLRSVYETADGGYILGGMSDSPAGGDKSSGNNGSIGKDFWIIKLDDKGNKLWDKTIGGTEDEVLSALHLCTDGSYLLAGYSASGVGGNKSQANLGKEDYWLVKLDAQGNKVWDKTFGGSGMDLGTAIVQTSDGGYLLGGSSDSGVSNHKSGASRGLSDFWVIKLDANGNKLWDKTLGGKANDNLTALQQTSDGGFILAGSSESGSSGDKTNGVNGPSDFWTVKLDASGTKIWDKTVGGSTQDNANALQVLPNEAFVVGGSSNSRFGYDKTQASRGNFDFWFAKMRSSCANLAAELIPACTNGIGTLTVKVSRLNNAPWTLKYSIGGVEQSITQTSPEVVLATAPPPGTVFLLKSLTFSGCTKSLNQAFAFPSVQNELTVISEKSCWPEPVVLAVKGAPSGHKYSWYTVPTGGSPVWQDSTGRYTISGLQTPVIYYVAASNKLGCEGPRMQVLARPNTCEVFIPNIISSNQDGKNDTFQPQNLTSGKWQLQIYNRWGKKIFETEDYRNTWPENNVTAGTYFYKLQHLETGQKYKGWLEVVR